MPKRAITQLNVRPIIKRFLLIMPLLLKVSDLSSVCSALWVVCSYRRRNGSQRQKDFTPFLPSIYWIPREGPSTKILIKFKAVVCKGNGAAS
jgi:hypothetical protein